MEKRRTTYLAAIVVIVIIVGALIYVNTSSPQTKNLISFDNQAVSPGTIAALQSIAHNNTLANMIGIGAASGYPIATGNTKVLLIAGKPAVIYVGADFCPFCAATRWGMIIALMRFGNFSSLHYMTSSATDVYPSTPTFTFFNSSYSSSIITFEPVETETNTYHALQTPNLIQNLTFSAYDEYFSKLPPQERGGIPFIDFGNISVQDGAEVDPQLLDGNTWQQIIAKLSDPSTSTAQAEIGSANIFTAQICGITNNTPASVCNQPYIKNVERAVSGTA